MNAVMAMSVITPTAPIAIPPMAPLDSLDDDDGEGAAALVGPPDPLLESVPGVEPAAPLLAVAVDPARVADPPTAFVLTPTCGSYLWVLVHLQSSSLPQQQRQQQQEEEEEEE
ncbi:hypothetical protein GP486_008549 [Trichoglossum hirsutum]|uniref:Uncharacterized protein n=1 Tax=Trichoglossum hirsutum TaxID=265104 RepID=A0A9P8I5U2_9PEZI|nr:hypothetical protein GP486_008549 [Trichoglossum hirsutum]